MTSPNTKHEIFKVAFDKWDTITTDSFEGDIENFSDIVVETALRAVVQKIEERKFCNEDCAFSYGSDNHTES